MSLVSNFRSQFNKIINGQGYNKLVKKLRTMSEEFKAPQAMVAGKAVILFNVHELSIPLRWMAGLVNNELALKKT